ncbi:DUF3224 domain-containing protein [Amycolatopsis benzoatilytica]|uniref:DUF3224 domain-containing protein n=1 Tax=Amycolatopsis benzoatilytica TaxID=346045 RepID=UPI00037BB338|nr:DUF3224 domain-containing protein [Amycolatopsis benzoatilytica]
MNTFSTKKWDEHVASGKEGGPRVAYVHAEMEYSGAIEGAASADYLLYYPGEGYDGGTHTSPGYDRFDATVDGRRGTFVVRHEWAFDAQGIGSKFEVVAGSGTGELAGLSGTGTTHGVLGEPAVSYTFDYTL